MPRDTVVILTRESADNAALRGLLTGAGVNVVEYACIRTVPIPMERWKPTGEHPMEHCRVLAFTSRHGVQGFAPAWERLDRAARYLAAVGSGTAREMELRLGRRPDMVACPPTAEGLATQLAEFLDPAHPVLWIRGNRSTGDFRDRMTSQGFKVTELVVYETCPVRLQPLSVQPPAVLVFASPSAVENFFRSNRPEWKNSPCIAIGPTTARSLTRLGCIRVEQPQEPVPRALADRIALLLQEVK